MTIITLAKKVKAMREVQKLYFSTRSKKALIQSKELEKEVDQAIAELEHLQLPGAIDDLMIATAAMLGEADYHLEKAVNGYSYTTEGGTTRHIGPEESQAQIWKHKRDYYEVIMSVLESYDRLQRKLNQKEETHES